MSKRKPITNLADLHAYLLRRAKENEQRGGRWNVDQGEGIWERARLFGKAAAYNSVAEKVKVMMDAEEPKPRHWRRRKSDDPEEHVR
jgi:hypothetical protein